MFDFWKTIRMHKYRKDRLIRTLIIPTGCLIWTISLDALHWLPMLKCTPNSKNCLIWTKLTAYFLSELRGLYYTYSWSATFPVRRCFWKTMISMHHWWYITILISGWGGVLMGGVDHTKNRIQRLTDSVEKWKYIENENNDTVWFQISWTTFF